MSFPSHLRAYRTQEARLVELRMTVLEYQGHCFKVNVPLAGVIPGREGWDRGLTAVHNLLKPQCHSCDARAALWPWYQWTWRI